jgi:hypothetical protein
MAPEQTEVGDQFPEPGDLVTPPQVVATTMSATPVSSLPSVREDAGATPPSPLLAAGNGLLVVRVADSAAADAGTSGPDEFAEAAGESARPVMSAGPDQSQVERTGPKQAEEAVPLDPADRVFQAIMGE